MPRLQVRAKQRFCYLFAAPDARISGLNLNYPARGDSSRPIHTLTYAAPLVAGSVSFRLYLMFPDLVQVGVYLGCRRIFQWNDTFSSSVPLQFIVLIGSTEKYISQWFSISVVPIGAWTPRCVLPLWLFLSRVSAEGWWWVPAWLCCFPTVSLDFSPFSTEFHAFYNCMGLFSWFLFELYLKLSSFRPFVCLCRRSLYFMECSNWFFSFPFAKFPTPLRFSGFSEIIELLAMCSNPFFIEFVGWLGITVRLVIKHPRVKQPLSCSKVVSSNPSGWKLEAKKVFERTIWFYRRSVM